jgi:hypothetical protein
MQSIGYTGKRQHKITGAGDHTANQMGVATRLLTAPRSPKMKPACPWSRVLAGGVFNYSSGPWVHPHGGMPAYACRVPTIQNPHDDVRFYAVAGKRRHDSSDTIAIRANVEAIDENLRKDWTGDRKRRNL